MPLIHTSADDLPIIDAAPSAEALASANARILAELSTLDTTTLHPSLPAPHEAQFSDLVNSSQQQLSSNAEGQSSGIDLTRYEAVDAPPATASPAAWKASLQQAYTSHEYLRGREMNLALLETYGKNAWLVGNSQLEDILRDLEREVEAGKVELEAVEQARRAQQASVEGEVKGLEEGWRRGMRRLIETQAAKERLRVQVLERKRAGVS